MRGDTLKRLFLAVLLVAAMAGQVFFASRVHSLKRAHRQKRLWEVRLPGKMIRLASLDYRGIISDVMFLDLAVFFGDPNKKVDQKFINRALRMAENITFLDPYFQDPYYIAEALAWDADEPGIHRINDILDKAARRRTWDGWMPFLLGVNHFFFLKDDLEAIRYFEMASARPGGPKLAGVLASRLYSRTGRTGSAVLLLKEMLEREEDPARAKLLKKRLLAYYHLYLVEKAVEEYVKKTGEKPGKVEDLVAAGILKSIPKDPYGGRFVITEEGRVASTSGFREKKTGGNNRAPEGGPGGG